MAVVTTNLGVVTAYGDAVAAGYTGTKAEWQALMASYATVAEEAAQSASDAETAKNAAVTAKTDAETAKTDAIAAKTAAQTAQTAAETAAQDAEDAAQDAEDSAASIASSASQIAQNTSDITELKSGFSDLKEDLNDIKEEVYSEVETEVTKTSQIDGTYIRYVNGAWQTLENNANYRLMTYSAQENTKYHLVNGSIYKPYVPAVIFYHDDTILGSSEVSTEQTWKGEKVASLYFITPPTCNKIVTNNFGNPPTWTPALYIISYEGKVTELDERVNTLESYDLNTKVKKLQNVSLAVMIDQRNITFEKRASNSIIITLPYRMIVFGNTTYASTINFDSDVTSGTVSYTVPAGSYLIYDYDSHETIVTDWGGFTNNYNNYVYLAHNEHGYISSGILHPYWNTYNIKSLEVWKDSQYPSSYYFDSDYLSDKVIEIRNKAVENTVSFAFITDVHVRTNHLNAFKLMKYIDDRTNAIPFVIFGGDVHASDGNPIAEVLKDGDTWLDYMSLYGKDRVYQCKGNHDFNTVINGVTTYAGLPTEYYYLRKNTDQIVDNPQVSPSYGNKTMFYSFDDDINKVRYIILDNYDGSYTSDIYNATGISRTQVDWLISKLDEGTGYSCVVVSHETSDPTMTHYVEASLPIQKILKAFANKEAVEYTGQGVHVSADFTNTANTLICHISGHAHLDESHTEDGVLSIATVCDALYPRPTAYGTTAEQAFDIFYINTTDKEIYALRIGGGVDRSWTY